MYHNAQTSFERKIYSVGFFLKEKMMILLIRRQYIDTGSGDLNFSCDEKNQYHAQFCQSTYVGYMRNVTSFLQREVVYLRVPLPFQLNCSLYLFIDNIEFQTSLLRIELKYC